MALRHIVNDLFAKDTAVFFYIVAHCDNASSLTASPAVSPEHKRYSSVSIHLPRILAVGSSTKKRSLERKRPMQFCQSSPDGIRSRTDGNSVSGELYGANDLYE